MKIHQSALPVSRLFLLLASALLISVVHAEEAAPAAPAADKPVVITPESIEKGRAMYRRLCLRCHGPEMVGGNNAFDLRTFPLDQHDRFVNSVTNGKRAMPPWKGIITDEEIGHLWSYVGSRGGTL
jgi:mono/diheme cytochrome c family protein